MLHQFASFFLDFFFPIFCVGCKKEKTHCCETCFKKIPRLSEIQKSMGLDQLIAACPFHEKSLLAKLIHRFKYEGAKQISEILVALFPQCIHGNVTNAAVIPVPLHRRRLNFRGFNQSLVLAQELNKKFGFDIKDILQRHRYTEPQIELQKEERQKNVFDAFSMRNPKMSLNSDSSYVLVDDVCTTGSTLYECAKVLKKHGAKKICGMVIGRAV